MLQTGEQRFEPEGDPVDLLLVEPKVQEGVQNLRAHLSRRGVRRASLAKPGHLVEDLADPVDVPLLVEVGIVGVDVPDDVLDPQPRVPELGAEEDNLVHRGGRTEHDLQDAPLPVLDALRDRDLAFARQQRERGHLAQVGAHRIGAGGVRRISFGLGVAHRFGIRPHRHLPSRDVLQVAGVLVSRLSRPSRLRRALTTLRTSWSNAGVAIALSVAPSGSPATTASRLSRAVWRTPRAAITRTATSSLIAVSHENARIVWRRPCIHDGTSIDFFELSPRT